VQLEGFGPIEEVHLIGPGTPDLLACSIVPEPHTRLIESNTVFQMDQNKIKPSIALGAPFKVEIPANINYLLGP
jgi:hypothetical protein